MHAPDPTSTRPYLIRALYEWCTDNGFTPYVAVRVDESVRVPLEFVKDGEIVLNIGFDATSGMKLGNEFIEFKARFGGVAREIVVPVGHVMAIYARENGQGMAFPVVSPAADAKVAATSSQAQGESAEAAQPMKVVQLVSAEAADRPETDDPAPPKPPSGPRPTLTRIK
ncbi:MAG: ClpXP protease specificity-enhancing factor [Burkholderiaceae bacterium]|nr:ClpXP protease specificity-enhancing factor [Burkholderiaceae bacterium]